MMSTNRFAIFCLSALALVQAPSIAQPANAQRQAEVAKRGPEVMPFSLQATQHIFTKTQRGGVQRVVARNPRDLAQVRLVRQHLREIREQFLRADFSGPAHIHGRQMPGLAELEAAPPGAIQVEYARLNTGAQLTYSTGDPKLVKALHRWFDAQLSDHGADAMEGQAHPHREHGAMHKP